MPGILEILKLSPAPQSVDYVENKKQFHLFSLLTEQRHPRTWNMSFTIQSDMAAGLELSAIFLLGVGGVERSEEHALASVRLASEMDPRHLSALTLSVVPGTPQDTLTRRGRFERPPVPTLLSELRTFVAEARPTAAVFTTNHASNYVPIAGTLPADRHRLLSVINAAIDGRLPLRPEWSRGL